MLISTFVRKNVWGLGFTMGLILVEAILSILFPYFIGKAISGVIDNTTIGLWYLGVLAFSLIFIGGFRRFFDSRFYAKIYTQMSMETTKQLPVDQYSVKAARLSMLDEMVKFAEFQLPAIIQHSIGLIGILIIIAFLNINVFFGALITGIIVVGIYLLSSNKTFLYNQNFNNEFENQVDVLIRNKQSELKHHLIKLMRWNIKLSDIETINFSASWLIMIFLLITTIFFSASQNEIEYGALFALIMYVYQFIESMISLPLYYQQWLRLSEITHRMNEI